MKRLWRRFVRWFRPTQATAGMDVTDMGSVILALDPDVSQFTTMLMRLQGPPPPDPRIWGEWDWKSEWERRRDEALAYFVDKPRPGLRMKVDWLEDEFFPRVFR